MKRPLAARAAALSLAAVVVLAACSSAPVGSDHPVGSGSGATATPAPPTAPADPRTAGWISDLESIIPGLERLHPDPYHSTPKATIAAAIAELEASIPTASDDALMVGVMRVIAMVSAAGRDGHTGAYVWGAGRYATHSLPLRLWAFPEGIVVVDALPPYEGLVGRTVATIDGQSIADVAAALDPLIPRDNPETVTLLLPRFLLTTEILHGAGLVADASRVTLGFADAPAAPVPVDAITTAAYNDWATPYGLFLPVRDDVPYLARSTEPFWSRVDGGTTLVIQYNRVNRLAGTALDSITTAIATPGIDRVIVDIRHNYGGDSFGYVPVADALVARSSALTRGLFLITGRNTFSAASLFTADLTNRTRVTTVGEPMGGSPNLWGNARDLSLAASGIVISVATEYFQPVPGDERIEIEVDRPVPLTLADFLAGRDPALASIEGGS